MVFATLNLLINPLQQVLVYWDERLSLPFFVVAFGFRIK